MAAVVSLTVARSAMRIAAAALVLCLSLCPNPARADGLGIEALFTGSAFTSKQGDTYADQPGSGVGGLLRLHGSIRGDARWIAGGVAEQVQRGAFLGAANESGNRFGGQLGLAWMANEAVRLEFVFEAGTRSSGPQWFRYFGFRPAVTWMHRGRSGVGVLASLGFLWRKELQDEFGPIAPAGGREIGGSLGIGFFYE
jgi:hypothetical protein